MNKAKPKIVFFGTGPVSLMCLEGISTHFDIETIITKPDQEIHGKLHDHPVKSWAMTHNIPAHQVANKQELSNLFGNRHFKSTVGLVVDFGIIINQDVINYFPQGIINSHFSLLPEWRGADPISFALLSGQPVTGVSLMLINAGMDEGNLIAQKSYKIPTDITIHTLSQELSELSNQMLIEILPQYIAGKIFPWPQDKNKPPTYSRKLTKADGLINWDKPASVIEREIRTFVGWPGSRTLLFDKDIIITKAHITPLPALTAVIEGATPAEYKPGQTVITATGILAAICGQDALIIDRLKPAGKREMAAADFIRGLNR